MSFKGEEFSFSPSCLVSFCPRGYLFYLIVMYLKQRKWFCRSCQIEKCLGPFPFKSAVKGTVRLRDAHHCTIKGSRPGFMTQMIVTNINRKCHLTAVHETENSILQLHILNPEFQCLQPLSMLMFASVKTKLKIKVLFQFQKYCWKVFQFYPTHISTLEHF